MPAEEVEEAETSEPETDEAEAEQPATEGEEIEYSLFVPGPERLRARPADGRAAAGRPDRRARPARPGGADLFEVVRSGRTLPDGDVCVYLAQV